MSSAKPTVELGPERVIFSDGLQPFLFRTSSGTLFVQAQLQFPPGYVPPAKNAYPGIPGNVISRDGGQTWARWRMKRRDQAPPPSQSFWDKVKSDTEIGP